MRRLARRPARRRARCARRAPTKRDGTKPPVTPQFHCPLRLTYATCAAKSSRSVPTRNTVCSWRSRSMSPNVTPKLARRTPPNAAAGGGADERRRHRLEPQPIVVAGDRRTSLAVRQARARVGQQAASSVPSAGRAALRARRGWSGTRAGATPRRASLVERLDLVAAVAVDAERERAGPRRRPPATGSSR